MSPAATTHQEIYRRFDGALKPHPIRFLPLYASQVRVHYKRKLPLLLLYAGPAIVTLIGCFNIYTQFAIQEAAVDGDVGARILAAMARQRAEAALAARAVIAQINVQIQAFALLAIAWFGAGLIAEDNKLGAHLLYFSRPLTRLDYFLGHFLTVCWFGFLAVGLPAIVLSVIAIFTSPEYSFLKEQWEVPLVAVGFATISVVLLSSLTLAVSSLVKRKSMGLVALVGVVVGSETVSVVMAGLKDDENYLMIGLWNNLIRLGDWMFTSEEFELGQTFDWEPMYSVWIVAAVTAGCLAICWARLRRMEGVG